MYVKFIKKVIMQKNTKLLERHAAYLICISAISIKSSIQWSAKKITSDLYLRKILHHKFIKQNISSIFSYEGSNIYISI